MLVTLEVERVKTLSNMLKINKFSQELIRGLRIIYQTFKRKTSHTKHKEWISITHQVSFLSFSS